MSRINFADKVKIVVPDVFMHDEDEAAALSSSPQRPGGIDVQTDEIALCDADDGAPATIDEAYFVDTLRHYLDERADDASYRRLPDSAMAFIAPEAPDGGAPETYEWWNMCMTHGKARIAHVTLRPSATGDGSPPDPAFARYLDGAIRRAEFPDLGAPGTYVH